MDKKKLLLIISITLLGVLGGVHYAYNNGFIAFGKVGLYQYIRKGHQYIDENKYEKALFLFHKAYESLPSSDEIKEHLVYGYVKYAKYLDKKGELDKAIENLEIMHEIDKQNIPVVHDLAYLYIKKGIKDSRDKKYALAVRSVQKGVLVAENSNSKKTKTSISNYLFNEANDAYRADDIRTTLLVLHASYILRPRFESLVMLGRVNYDQNELEKALFYLLKAREMDPEDKSVNDAIERIKKEIEVDKNMREVQSGYFNIRFNEPENIKIDNVSSVLSGIYEEVGNDLKTYPPKGTSVILYNEKEFREIFKQKGITRAFYDGNIRIAVDPDIGDIQLPEILSHEYTHAVISMMTENKCPVWLHEGIAVYEQSKYGEPSLNYLERFIADGGVLSLEGVEEGFEEHKNVRTLGISYAGAYMAVVFILERWGWPGLRGLLEKVKRGKHFTNAIDEEFYISTETFENMWNEYMKGRFSKN